MSLLFNNIEMNLIVDSFGGRKLFTEIIMVPLYKKIGFKDKPRTINKDFGLLILEYALMNNCKFLGYSFSNEEKEKKFKALKYLFNAVKSIDSEI